MPKFWRLCKRGAGFGLVITGALLDWAWRVRRGKARESEWMNRWGRATLKALEIEVEQFGTAPKEGLLVANHLSYADIPLLAGCGAMRFVSKAEVKKWPIIGLLASVGGTIFLQRENRGEVRSVNEQIHRVLDGGEALAFFPEGTSTDGSKVLPFRSSLLAPAAELEAWVTPAWIEYEVSGGQAGEDVCYWGEMTFLPHFLKLLTLPEIKARVVFGTRRKSRDRKQLAQELREDVLELQERHGSASGEEPEKVRGRELGVPSQSMEPVQS